MEIYISTYEKFRLKQIPENIMCVGVSKEIPEDFRTTSIHNFLYTPKNILGATYREVIPPDIFVEEYQKRLKQNIRKLGFQTLEEYFRKMISSFDNGEVKGVCFLDEEISHWYNAAVILMRVFEELGYTVKQTFKKSKPEKSFELF